MKSSNFKNDISQFYTIFYKYLYSRKTPNDQNDILI